MKVVYFIRQTKGLQVDIDDPSLDSMERNHTKQPLLERAKEIVDALARGGLHGWLILDEHSNDELVVVMHDWRRNSKLLNWFKQSLQL